VRSLVGIITTIATVIHFTFGCCLHPCHFGGCSETAAHAVESAACDACCHDHDDVTSECANSPCGPNEAVHAVAGRAMITVPDRCLGCNGCQGCHCVATSTETGTVVSWTPLASGIAAALDSHAIVLFAVACGRQPPDSRMHPSAGRDALFERFLI